MAKLLAVPREMPGMENKEMRALLDGVLAAEVSREGREAGPREEVR